MTRSALLRGAVRRLTDAVSGSVHLHELYQAIVDEAARLTDAASAALCLLVESGDQLDFVAVAGQNAGQIVGLRIRVADSLSESVIKEGHPVVLDSRRAVETGDLFSDQDLDGPQRVTFSRYNPALRSAVVVPVEDNGKLIGTLVCQNKGGDKADALFDQDDIETLAMIAGFAAAGHERDRLGTRICEQSRELAVLYDAAQTVAGSLNVQQVLESVLTALCSHIEYHCAALFLLNDERTHLFIAAERGLTEQEREIQLSVDLSVDTGPHAQCVATGQPMLITDTEAAEGFRDFSERARALSAMIAPIRSRNELHGLLVVTSLQRGAFEEGDFKLASAVGMQAGIAMENAWLYEDAQRQAQQSGALYDLSQHVNATLDLDSVLDFVAQSVVNLLNVGKFALLLADQSDGRLVPKLTRGMEGLGFEEYRPAAGEGVAGWVYEWQTPQAVADLGADPRDRLASLERFGVASVLCVPMHVGEEVVGVLMGMSSRRRLFTVGEMELLYTISNQAAVAIYNALQYRGARSRAHEMSRYFRRIAHALGSSFDGNGLPQVICELAIAIMRADRCAIYALEDDQLRLRASSRFRASAPPDAFVPVGRGLAGWVARRGQSLTVANLDDDARWQASAGLHKEHLASYLAVPLKAGRRTVGVIEIYAQQPREFTREESQLLAMFTRRTRVAERMADGS